MNYRMILTVFITILVPAILQAQDGVTATTEQATPLVQPAADVAATVQVPGTSAAQPPAPRPLERKRRPGMIAYIEDATVASQVRVRFDAGFGNSVPDRAEFFYAKCSCYQFDPPPNFDPDAPGPGPGVPTELRFQQVYIQAEYAWQQRLSLFAELPVRAIQPQGFIEFGAPWVPFPSQSGLGDIRVGGKAALLSDDDSDLTAQVRVSIPTGDPAKGLGTDTVNVEPGLLFHQRLTDRVGLEAQISTWHPFGGSAGVDSPDKFTGTIITYGVGPSFDLVSTDRIRFTPVVELVGWRVIGGFQTKCAADLNCTYDADDNIFNVKLGARTTVADRNSFYVGYGYAVTDAVWYGDIVRFEYRFRF